MTLEKTSEQESGLEIKLGGQTVYHNVKFPSALTIRTPDLGNFSINRQPMSFLSRETYVICEASGTELASISNRGLISGHYSGWALLLGDNRYPIVPRFKPWWKISFGAYELSIPRLSVQCAIQGSYLDCTATSNLASQDASSIATTLLLQYFGISKWRQ